MRSDQLKKYSEEFKVENRFSIIQIYSLSLDQAQEQQKRNLKWAQDDPLLKSKRKKILLVVKRAKTFQMRNLCQK